MPLNFITYSNGNAAIDWSLDSLVSDCSFGDCSSRGFSRRDSMGSARLLGIEWIIPPSAVVFHVPIIFMFAKFSSQL